MPLGYALVGSSRPCKDGRFEFSKFSQKRRGADFSHKKGGVSKTGEAGLGSF